MGTRSDQAAQAAIGAAARELRLPTIRAEATRLAEIAGRERQSYPVLLAEVLAAEVDDRTERRRARRITEAKFPRIKRLSEFNLDAVPTIQPAQLATLASGSYLDTGEPVVLLGDSGTGKTHRLIGLGLAALRARPPRPLRHHRAAGQRARRSRQRTHPVPRHSPLRPPRPALPGRNRLPPDRPPRRRTAVPDHHRTRGTRQYRADQ
jgi:hypothetical protein